VRRKLALWWLLQLVLPGAIAAYGLLRATFGRPPSDLLWLTVAGCFLWVAGTVLVLLASRNAATMLLRVGLSLWVTAITWSLAMACLIAAHVRVDLAMTMWRVRQALAGQALEGKEIGLFTSHPRYGWWHLGGAVGRHTFLDYSVLYTTGEDRFRVTRTAQNPAGEVLCLGCSFTFGAGVSDQEPYVAILADRHWTNMKVHNAGVNGWGTAQALLLAEDYFANHPAPAVVLYGWIAKHLERNSLRKRWLEFLAKYGRKNPCFEITKDSLAFRGLCGPEDGLPDSPGLDATELELSVQMLSGIEQICRKHGTPFVVVLLPYASKAADYNRKLDSLTDQVATRARKLGVQCLDVRQCTADLDRDPLYFAHDPHPRPRWHELVAHAIASAIAPRGTSDIIQSVASKSRE